MAVASSRSSSQFVQISPRRRIVGRITLNSTHGHEADLAQRFGKPEAHDLKAEREGLTANFGAANRRTRARPADDRGDRRWRLLDTNRLDAVDSAWSGHPLHQTHTMFDILKSKILPCLCTLSLVGPALIAQSVPSSGGGLSTGGFGGGTSGTLSTTAYSSGANRVAVTFSAVAEALRPPAATQPAMTMQQLCSAYAGKFQAASQALEVMRQDLANPSVTPAAMSTTARRISASLYSIRMGFEGIAADISDTVVTDTFSHWLASHGYMQLASQLPPIHASLVDAQAPALAASNALSNMVVAQMAGTADPFELYFTSLKDLYVAQVDLVDAVSMDVATPTTTGQAPIQCPPGMFRGCTIYRTTTRTAISCGPWTLLSGGITITIPFLSTTICPNGGLWQRTCTYRVCITEKCVCYCFPSEWERSWGINGTNKTVSTRTYPCFDEPGTETEWECGGPPPATLPTAPIVDKSARNDVVCG
jgi:hypothetical protein